MSKWYKFMNTTITKLCDARSTGALNKAYTDARDGWKTAKGEDRGGFDRLGLSNLDVSLINKVYNRLFNLMEKED